MVVLGWLLRLALASILIGGPTYADELQIVALEPAARSIGASIHTPIVVRFDRPLDPTSITAGNELWAFGRASGTVTGSYVFADGNRTVTLVPDHPLAAGENVMVILSANIEGADAVPLRAAGYSYQFWTRAQPATKSYTEIDRMTTRIIPSETSRAYGGIASDLDVDGFLDLTIVNEDTADLRVFMNKADQTGLYDPFLVPTFPVGDRASPSEPADFNRDGFVDVCVANINDDSVSIVLGNGDGTFAPQQEIPVGLAPRGIAVLDVDGDGDVDIVNTNAESVSPNMSLMLNDGNGVFSAPTFFPAGASSAWALAAGDMDEDGILDLVIGARLVERILVRRGLGNGTFTALSSRPAGGKPWMVALGDLNGDGHEDVSSANSSFNNGSILFGDGLGTLAAAQTYATDPFALATDLGDLDGDDDLDWITSSYSGDWWVYENDGQGGFVFDQSLPSAQSASCSVMLDFDNDGDLDLALIDELEDEVILMRNGGLDPAEPPPAVPDGTAATTPLLVAKLDPGAVGLALTWDATSCPALDWHVLYGGSPGLPTVSGGLYGVGGSRCGVGTTQPFGWLTSPDAAADPQGLIWFLLVSSDGAGNEGSWGEDGQGGERTGPGPNGASNVCGIVDKDVSSTCTP